MKIIKTVICLFLIFISLTTSVSSRHHLKTKGENDKFNVVFISDIHHDPYFKYSDEAGDEKGNRGNTCQFKGNNKDEKLVKPTSTDFDKFYGVYNCNSNINLVDALFEEIKKINPSLIIFLGDTVAHGIDKLKLRLEIINVIKGKFEELKKQNPKLQIYIAFGNNDLNSKYNFPADNNEYNQEKDALFQIITPKPSNSDMFPYYSIWNEEFGFEFIFLFTTIYGVDHGNNTLPAYASDFKNKQKEFLENKLKELKKDKKQAIIGYHIPIHATMERSHNSMESNWEPNSREWFDNLMRDYKDTVYLIFSGHTHRADLHTRLDESFEPYFSVVNIPSLTPVKFNNPGFAVANFSNGSLDDLEYRFMNLGQTTTKSVNVFTEKRNIKEFAAEVAKEAKISIDEDDCKELNKYEIKKLLDIFYSSVDTAKKFVLFKEGLSTKKDEKGKGIVDREDIFYENHACSSFTLDYDWMKNGVYKVDCSYIIMKMIANGFKKMLAVYKDKPEKPKRRLRYHK